MMNQPAARRSQQPGILALSYARTVVELKQFFRNIESAVFTFLLPVFMLVIFASIFSFEIDGPQGEEPLKFRQYFVAGMIASGIFSTTFSSLALSISIEQHSGMLKRLAGTPLPRVAYFAGKAALATIASVIQTALMLLIGVTLYGLSLPADLPRWGVFLSVLTLGVAGCSLLGIAYTRVIPNARSAPAIVTPVFLALQFISGVFFVFTNLPGPMQAVASVFPLRWMALGLRYAFLPGWFESQEQGGTWNIPLVFGVLSLWLVVGLGAALRLFRWNRGAGA